MGKYYYCLVNGKLKQSTINKGFFSKNPIVWSARLATGLFGLTTCPSGNRGPKGPGEVILAIGEAGLQDLVRLGFVPCPTCRPEETTAFRFESIRELVRAEYGLSSMKEFADKTALPYDARRVRWEEILPRIGRVPSRIYLPSGLSPQRVLAFRRRINSLRPMIRRYTAPVLGYYSRSASGHVFIEYRSAE